MPAVHANIAENSVQYMLRNKKNSGDAKEKGLRRVKKIRKNEENKEE